MGNKGDKANNARKKVMQGLIDLRNEHKIVSILVWVTKFGNVFFGTDRLKEKAEKAFKCTCTCTCDAENDGLWQDALEQDEKTIRDTKAKFDLGMDPIDFLEIDAPLPRLPMKLDLMCYNDLSKWLRPQIVKNRHERGFPEGLKIKYKDMSWCPSFWPTDMCDWMEVSNFSQWEASEYSGLGNLTSVLKQAARNLLLEKNIENPDEYCVSNLDTNKEKRKLKWRGNHSNPEVFSLFH